MSNYLIPETLLYSCLLDREAYGYGKDLIVKKICFWLILIIIPTFVFIASAELFYVVFRADHHLYKHDYELGWLPKNNFSYEQVHSDIEGNAYTVTISTNEYGFRAWGDINADRKKILFIGDSFTGDPNMSDEDAYFGQVGKLLNAEVFAFGGGGYGTLQELLVFKKYVHIVNPDFFVLQFCSNDFFNNSFRSEERSIVRNQKNLRPYFEDNKIIYRLSTNHWYKYLYTHSALFRFLDIKLQQAQYARYNGYRFPLNKDNGEREKEALEAEQITVNLLKMMADYAPRKTILLTFTSDTKDHAQREKWIRVTEEAGFVSLPVVSESVELAEKEGAVVRAADGGHWSPQGHRVAGKALAGEIMRFMAASD